MSDIISNDQKLEAITKYIQLLPAETAKNELDFLTKNGIDKAYKRANQNIGIVKDMKNKKKRDNRSENIKKKEQQRKKEEEQRIVAKAQEMNAEAQNGYDLYYRIRNSLDFFQNIDQWTVDFDEKKINYGNLETYCKEISAQAENFDRLQMEIKFRVGKFISTVKTVLDNHNKNFDTNNPYADDWVKYLRRKGFNKSEDWFYKVKRFYDICKAYPNIRFVKGVTYTQVVTAWPYVKHLFLKDHEFWSKPKFKSIEIGTGLTIDNKPVYIQNVHSAAVTEPTKEDFETANRISGSYKRARMEEESTVALIEDKDEDDDSLDDEDDKSNDEKQDEAMPDAPPPKKIVSAEEANKAIEDEFEKELKKLDMHSQSQSQEEEAPNEKEKETTPTKRGRGRGRGKGKQ